MHKESVQLNSSLKFFLVLKKNSCGILTLGVDSPLALQYAVFFYNGLKFVLRGGKSIVN